MSEHGKFYCQKCNREVRLKANVELVHNGTFLEWESKESLQGNEKITLWRFKFEYIFIVSSSQTKEEIERERPYHQHWLEFDTADEQNKKTGGWKCKNCKNAAATFLDFIPSYREKELEKQIEELKKELKKKLKNN